MLQRLKSLRGRAEFVDTCIGACPAEPAVWAAAVRSGVDVYARSEASIAKGRVPLKTIFEFVEGIDCTHVMWLNPCAPFVRNATILEAARTFLDEPAIESLTAVRRLHTWLWDEQAVPLHQPTDDYATDAVAPTHACVHTFHIWPKNLMLTEGRPWRQSSANDPYLYVIDSARETLDADTPAEFDILRAVMALEHPSEREAIYAHG